MTDQLIKIKNLTKEFVVNKNKTLILKKIDFSLFKGDIISISGPSGSGKSTFLNILGLLDSQFEGEYQFLNYYVDRLKNNEKNIIRNQSIGFVHQFFHLIPELNVLENVSLPNLIHQNNYKKSIEDSINLLKNFELGHRIYSKPSNLSGGEQQRVAIARALINKPDILIADEMTGNLDEKTANSVFDFFLDTIKLNNQSLVYVTHNKKYANKANEVYEISDHKLNKVK
jgi:lipoprotein-releasing system ATP-binding protein